MYVSDLKIVQGTKILWEGTIREVAFEIGYILGVNDSWADAEERGKAITSQMIQDWLEEMEAQGRIELIDQLTFLATFESGLVEETDYRIKKATGHDNWISDIPSARFEDNRILGEEMQKGRNSPRLPRYRFMQSLSSTDIQKSAKQVKNSSEGFTEKAVKLTFEATASQERAVRILRAYEEPMSFIHQANGNWTCLHKDKSYSLFVDMESLQGYCTCQDFQKRGINTGMPCKHIYAFLLQDDMMWAKHQRQNKEVTKE